MQDMKMENYQVMTQTITQDAIQAAKAVIQAIKKAAGLCDNAWTVTTAKTSPKASGLALKQSISIGKQQ